MDILGLKYQYSTVTVPYHEWSTVPWGRGREHSTTSIELHESLHFFLSVNVDEDGVVVIMKSGTINEQVFHQKSIEILEWNSC